jgi:hypothetical protein
MHPVPLRGRVCAMCRRFLRGAVSVSRRARWRRSHVAHRRSRRCVLGRRMCVSRASPWQRSPACPACEISPRSPKRGPPSPATSRPPGGRSSTGPGGSRKASRAASSGTRRCNGPPEPPREGCPRVARPSQPVCVAMRGGTDGEGRRGDAGPPRAAACAGEVLERRPGLAESVKITEESPQWSPRGSLGGGGRRGGISPADGSLFLLQGPA